MAGRRKKKIVQQEQKGQEVHSDEEHNGKEVQVDEEENMSGSQETQSTRSTRGRTQMHKLAMQRAQGLKKDVQFNELGQPIGDSAAELQSYIGVLAREKVKLNFKTWKHVPQDIKDKIWDAVNLSFRVPAIFKKPCLSSANDKWRQYKTQLTNNFIWKRLNDEENLHKPPPGYGIMGDEWSQFVISRMSEDFKKLSEQQKVQRKQNLYPHRLARKGYARLASEISTELCDDDEVNRAILWKKGRTSKQGEIEGDVLKTKFTKIDEYIQQKQDGLLQLQGPNEDILTQALESKEHGGRVRAIGGHVNPSTYFRLGKGMLPNHEKNVLLRRQATVEDRVAKLENLVLQNVAFKSSSIEEKGSCTAKDAKGAMKLSEEEIGFMKQKLDFEDDDDELQFIDKEDVLEKQCKKKPSKEVKKLELNSSSMPKSLWLLYCYYKRALGNGESLKIVLDENVFGEECTLYVHDEDVTPFCQLMPISYTCIAVYIWYLYKKMMEDNKLEKFRFMQPCHVGHVPTTRTDKNFLDKQLESRARALADRLIDNPSSASLLVPCNVGFHWILTVINLSKDIVYLWDPLSHRIRDDDWKHVVEMAIKMVHAASGNGKKGRSKTAWEIVKAPRQPDSNQCGFYVMAYLKTLIENMPDIDDKDSVQALFQQVEYDKAVIDLVRSEWADILSSYIQ
ncbi:PREDICTED: uncharacterized protein LOC109190440 [Ipomoea nil]|uniref:Transposase n=1 Tax=Ipomoea nil TaxID=35883 RepID=A0A1B4ZBC1_IPONI|nr:PREDICTED: uncharacterized protein LOC109190440 [Ipomoea nil]BAV56710.1 transposase [Ipomoea nil]